MADSSWEHAAEARAALKAIVTDPDHGVAALSSPRTVSNLLKDLLPDAPREKNLLVAAAEAGLADTLREHVDQGMDPGTAIRLTASSFSERSPIGQDACAWVTNELALAMGISDAADRAIADRNTADGAGAGYAVGADSGIGAGSGAGAANGARPDAAGAASAALTESSGPPTGGAWASPAGAPSGGAWASPGAAPGGGAWASPGGGPWASPGANPGAGGWYGTGNPGSGNPSSGATYAAQPGYAPASGQPAGPYPGPAYQPAPMPGYQPVSGRSQSSNTMAVVAFVLGVAQVIGWFIFLVPGLLAAVLAVVLGFVSIKQMNRTGERGRGLATTGIILGFAGIAIVGLLIIIGVAAMNSGGYSN